MTIKSPSVTRPGSITWMKLNLNTRTDPVVQMLSFDDQRHLLWLMMLEMGGVLTEDYATDAIRDGVIAKALGLTIETALEVRARLSELKLIDKDLWITCGKPVDNKNGDNGDASQQASHVPLAASHKTSAERTREYRARQKAAKLEALKDSDGHSDVAVTSQSVTSDALEKEQELYKQTTTSTPKSVDNSESGSNLPSGITRDQADRIVDKFTEAGYTARSIDTPRNLRIFAGWVGKGVTPSKLRESIERMHTKLGGVHSKPVTYIDAELKRLKAPNQREATLAAAGVGA